MAAPANGRPPKSDVLTVDAKGIPALLKAYRRWVCWSWTWTGNKWDKPPRTPGGSPASSTDPGTRVSFAEALEGHEAGRCDGIGFVLGRDPETGIVFSGVDRDDVRDPQSGKLAPWAAWEAGVLSRVGDPKKCQQVIAERQDAIDAAAAESATVRDAFRAELERRGFDADFAAVWMPSAMVASILGAATGERYPVNRASVFLGTLSIEELRKGDREGRRRI